MKKINNPSSGVVCVPFILNFLESVEPWDGELGGQYDAEAQLWSVPSEELFLSGTQRTRSYQNSTSGYSMITGYEDYDDQYVTESD